MKRNASVIPKNSQAQRKKVYIENLDKTSCAPILLIALQNEKFYYRVKKKQIDAQLTLSIFRQPLHFRAFLVPSSGSKIVCIKQLVLIILFR